MNNNTLISIIIPCYNVEKYITECIDSIIGQTYTNLEVILVDDGSTDSTASICDSYAAKHNIIKVIHQENKGLSLARYSGFCASTGKYITFVDSDDYIDSDYVQTLLDTLYQTNADMVCCRFYSNDRESGEIKKPSPNPIYSFTTDGKGFMKRLYNNAYLGTAWAKLASRDIYSELYFPDVRGHEDVYSIIHLALPCKKIVCIDKALYFYRLTKTSYMSSEAKMDIGIKADVNWKLHHIDIYDPINDEELIFEARKLLCHDIIARRENMSNTLKKELLPLYMENWKKIRFSKYMPLKSRIKYELISFKIKIAGL